MLPHLATKRQPLATASHCILPASRTKDRGRFQVPETVSPWSQRDEGRMAAGAGHARWGRLWSPYGGLAQ
jgi:hypothetical protein